jgi:zinc finger protein
MPKDILTEKTSLKRTDGEYKLPESGDNIPCPACENGVIQLKRTVYNLPDGDDIIILGMTCPACEFHRNDIIPLKSAFKPGKFFLTVDDGDLEHKLFRGNSGDIDIPEIGISIERGPAASFMINNLEGLLLIMRERVVSFIKSLQPNSIEYTNAQTSLNQLDRAMHGELNFTVILHDRVGGSYIVPTKPEKLKFVPESSEEEKLE